MKVKNYNTCKFVIKETNLTQNNAEETRDLRLNQLEV
jgi:hypothetical protein